MLRFIVKLYQQHGVESQCLTWQDTRNMDIPLLLFICWYSIHRGTLSPELLRELVSESKALSDNVVCPLRTLRREMKRAAVPASRQNVWQTLRDQVKQAELNAEFEILRHLRRLVDLSDTRSLAGANPSPPACAASRHHALEQNLDGYCQLLASAAETNRNNPMETPSRSILTAATLRLASA